MLNPDNAFLKPLHDWPVQSLTLDQPRHVFFMAHMRFTYTDDHRAVVRTWRR